MRRNAVKTASLIILLLTSTSIHAAKLAIVIDDLGYQAMPKLLSSLPQEVSISILPNTPFDLAVAAQAKSQHRETLLHMPMEPEHFAPLEINTLTSSMSQHTLQQTLRKALTRVPNAIAINNHMGSALSQDTQAMGWIMAELKQHNLHYLDSRTTAKSIAQKQAASHHVLSLRRHVFLDHYQTKEFVTTQLKSAIKRAKQYGYAIAIGHPHPITLSTLNELLPGLAAKEDITLVPLSALFAEI
jgi:uncharacterized protein